MVNIVKRMSLVFPMDEIIVDDQGYVFLVR